jgi:hypothetical protein
VVAKIVDDMDVVLEFHKYAAECAVYLRTTSSIESTNPLLVDGDN